eukprot:CAMPEP_0198323280 /NCGR_PEP_ID=MMETSP1450-20131203/11566_1 /TAXON_ID=753684 ORGANISM="Madagascaria erythrocladiodes, Strain CCMP3234" /NCGR_SAMPLE_ID=MMETSP1450 /ASSEMBLY_ACC=CAM_ASM_001115 /LENGTH=250 /DNA_ID=CAMNT_0044026967 /DNA_START=107 /DNA_END=857 /DNA_ORIENTATION=-
MEKDKPNAASRPSTASGRDASTVAPDSMTHGEEDEYVVDALAFSPRASDRDDKENTQPTRILTPTRPPSGIFEPVVDALAFSPRASDQDEKENTPRTRILPTTRPPSRIPGNPKWLPGMIWRVVLFGRGKRLPPITRMLILQVTTVNPRLGVLMLRQATRNFPGDPWAFVELGTLLSTQFAEFGQSLRCFALAAQMGSAVGTLCLGDQYIRGLGVPRDLAQGGASSTGRGSSFVHNEELSLPAGSPAPGW